jgi:hypothetical protein
MSISRRQIPSSLIYIIGNISTINNFQHFILMRVFYSAICFFRYIKSALRYIFLKSLDTSIKYNSKQIE